MTTTNITAAQISASGTLAGSTVDTVTVVGAGPVEVANVDGAAAIYVTYDGSTPTVGGQNTVVLPAAIGVVWLTLPPGDPGVIKLISSGTPKYQVTRVNGNG